MINIFYGGYFDFILPREKRPTQDFWKFSKPNPENQLDGSR